ncbi:MAG: transcriptional regulator, TetR family [Firmicutes bacterium]|nr:transcriptional regulator, TetR family [Bacillota bacterium]
MELEKDVYLKLITAATPLFAQKGLGGVSIRELAQAASVNSAAISYYFNGKEGLYQAVLEEQFSPIAAALEKIKEAKKLPAIDQLALYANQIAKIHHYRPFFIRFIFNEITNSTPCYDTVVKKYISQIFQFISQALAKGIASGDFKPELNINHAAISLAGILNFYFVANPLAKAVISPETLASDEDYTTQAFSIYLEGIRKRKEETL